MTAVIVKVSPKFKKYLDWVRKEIEKYHEVTLSYPQVCDLLYGELKARKLEIVIKHKGIKNKKSYVEVIDDFF